MGQETSPARMEEEKIVETLSDKSRSLRTSSVKKRLETEIKKSNPKVREKISKKRMLSKYRRKTANAKERERMKKMNDVFDTLKNVIPADNRGDDEDEKETKGTTLRSAIAYINCLKQLIEDCDAGLVDQTEFAEEEDKISESNIIPVKTPGSKKKVKTPKKSIKPVKGKVKGSKPVILDAKWTNYSPQFLGHKFAIPKDINMLEKMPSEQIYQLDTSYQNITHYPQPDMTTYNIINPYEECS